MSPTKEKRHDGPSPSRGDTVPAQGENQEPQPRMPHERDESADSQSADNPQARRMGKIAHDDLAEGQQDTGRSPATDETYHRLREDAERPPRK